MPGFRSSAARWFRAYLLPGAAFMLLLCPALDSPLAGTIDIDIHDGEPWAAIWDTDRLSATGNYMYDAEGMSMAFKVERIWFYHGGDYPESELPYQLGETSFSTIKSLY